MRTFMHMNIFEWLGLFGILGFTALAVYAYRSLPPATTYLHMHSESVEYVWDIQCQDGKCRTWKYIKGAREGRIDDGTRKHGPGNRLTFRNADGTWPEPKN